MRTPHLVPPSQQVIVILAGLRIWAGESGLTSTGAYDPRKPISENTVNKALRVMGYDTIKEACGHGFRTMACSALIESDLWLGDVAERQMSYQERNGVRAAYIHKAEHLEERRFMLQWWVGFLDANKEECISPLEYTKANNPLKRRLNAIYTHALLLKGRSTRLNQFLFYAGGTINQAEVPVQ